jgi:hypothetical protein
MVLFQTDCFRQVADANLPMPPRPLPNPFAGEEEQQNRLLEVEFINSSCILTRNPAQVTNPRPTSDLPLSPTPLPNPFSSEQGQKKRGFKVNSASDLLFEINGVSQVVNP